MFEIIQTTDVLVDFLFIATLAIFLLFGFRTLRGTKATWRDVHRTALPYNRYQRKTTFLQEVSHGHDTRG